jgi:hypothetical protein
MQMRLFLFFHIYFGFVISIFASDNPIRWNLDCNTDQIQNFDFLPKFPSKKEYTSHLVDVDNIYYEDSYSMIKTLLNPIYVPDACNKHLLPLRNKFQGNLPVIWTIDPLKYEKELFDDGFIVQWQYEDGLTFLVIDSNSSISIRISGFSNRNLGNFVELKQWLSKYLSKQFVEMLPDKEKYTETNNSRPKKILTSGYINLNVNGIGKNTYGFSNIISLIATDNTIYLCFSKLLDLSLIEKGRFSEEGRYYNLLGGPSRTWTKAEQKEIENRLQIMKKMEEEKEKAILDEISTTLQKQDGATQLIHQLNETKKDSYRHNLILISLINFYRNRCNTENNNQQEPFTLWQAELTTPAETDALRKILFSQSLETKKYAMYLINTTKCRSLLPELLQVCLNKEQVPNFQGTLLAPSNSYIKSRIYNFEVYYLIGNLGDKKTIRSLKELQKNAQLPVESKADIELAIENITRHLAEQNNAKQNWLNLRRDVREGKVATISQIIDIDKPDPEPISPEGFRKWETTDGLFKTTAKILGLIEVKNKAGKVTDKDVQLLRNDNKTVTIELSALRSIDKEYIRQQLEPEREWISADSNLKLKAKLLGKFDKEIIVQESDGINTAINIESLSDLDKEYLKQIPLSPHSKYVF